MNRDRDAPGTDPVKSGCEVRAARPADMPRIWELLRGLATYERLEHEVSGSAERLAEHLFGPRPPIECLVADSGRRLEGYALFYPTYSSFRTAPTIWLEDLFVEPGERGQGTGRALLAAVASLALDRGCQGLGWIVLDWNRPSIAFYQGAGARPAEGGWLQYGLDRVRMQALVESAAPSGSPE